MKLPLRRSEFFWEDLERQVDWYRNEAGPEVAVRFVDAVETTLNALAHQPDLGRTRFHQWPELAGMRSIRLHKPFHRFLLFYRHTKTTVSAERLVHGRRDLPKRLLESPRAEEQPRS